MRKNLTPLCGAIVFLLGAVATTNHAVGQVPGSAYGQPVENSTMPLGRNTPDPVITGATRIVARYDSAQMLRLALGLRHPNLAAEEQFLKDIQDRNSLLFHHYLTADEWTARFGPAPQDEQAVVDWAKAQGLTVTQRYPSRLIVDVEAPVSAVEKAFGFTINTYQIGATSFFSNDHDPVVPSAISAVLESVMGTNNLQVVGPAIRNFKAEIGGNPYAPGPIRSRGDGAHADAAAPRNTTAGKNAVTPSITNGYYDPTDIYASTAYDFNALQNLGHCCNPTYNSGSTPPSTSIAIATFSAYDNSTGKFQGGFNASDIQGFQNQYPYLAYHYAGPIYVDGFPGECCDAETTLDIEWSLATSNSFGSYVDTAYIHPYIGANNYLSTFSDVWMEILTENTTRIMSTSWGCSEGCWGGSAGVSTMKGIANALTGQGWTLVAASGDSGATTDCSTVSVDYPASDPNVVAAGGTTLYSGPGGFRQRNGLARWDVYRILLA